MPAANLPTPSPDEVDDLIYFARTGDLPSLQETVTSLCTTYDCSPADLLPQCIDVDAEGLGSRSSLLHYPAANGNVEIVRYVLGTLGFSDTTQNMTDNVASNKPLIDLVNHKNVSGNTPLHWAALNGHLEVVKLLVSAGADATSQNGMGRDAVVEAEMSGKEGASECAEWMLKNCQGLDRGVKGGVEAEAAAEEVQVSGQTDQEQDANGVERQNGEPSNGR